MSLTEVERKSALPNRVLLRDLYRQLLEDVIPVPPMLEPEEQRWIGLRRHGNASTLAKLEYFVEAVFGDPGVAELCSSGAMLPAEPKMSLLIQHYWSSFPDFLEIVGRLPDCYDYSEHVSIFRDCCVPLGLLEPRVWWRLRDNEQIPEPLRDQVNLFFTLAKQIHRACHVTGLRVAVCKRRYDARARHRDYCDYVNAFIRHYARIVVLRVDLGYLHDAEKGDAERATMDLDRFLALRRHNRMFRGWLGYIAKLEYGVQKGVHWHLVIILDGHKRDGSSHVRLAQDFGELWQAVTRSRGFYFNCNANSKEIGRMGQLGIGLIRDTDLDLQRNLFDRVIPYLTSTEQLLRPKVCAGFRTIRRGLPLKRQRGMKPG